ncbi:hypothetical protein X924_01315 [Petrotoga sp. 9PWA.NaAc.5.4]|nr:hypothetical protein X924_01315 [Petrotoga sp. 9PWA.NaAc.5.4]
MFLDFYNALFSPNKILNVTKKTFFIPIIIAILFIFSPIILKNPTFIVIGRINISKLKLILFILFFSYLSAGIRNLFSENNFFYSYISTISPLVLGLLGKFFLYIAICWILILRLYIDLKSKNYISMIIGLIFDAFLIFWLI